MTIARKIIELHTGTTDYSKYLDLTWSRPGQDVRYSIDDSKLQKLGWKAEADFQEELPKIVKYYQDNFIW
jgi:dTDP-D-glucose 4,6-dehydratase